MLFAAATTLSPSSSHSTLSTLLRNHPPPPPPLSHSDFSARSHWHRNLLIFKVCNLLFILAAAAAPTAAAAAGESYVVKKAKVITGRRGMLKWRKVCSRGLCMRERKSCFASSARWVFNIQCRNLTNIFVGCFSVPCALSEFLLQKVEHQDGETVFIIAVNKFYVI